MKKTDNYDLIIRFFEFDLNEEELAAFDKRLENDEAFFEEVSQVEKSQKMVTAMFDKDIADEKNRLRKEILENIRSSGQTTPVVQMPNTRWKYLLAVAATVAMLVAAFLFWPTPPPDHEAIASRFYQETNHIKHTGLLSTETPGNDEAKALERAFAQLQEKAYPNALATLEAIPKSSPKYKDALILEGRCYFEMNRVDLAIEKFGAASQLPPPEGLTNWYLALAALKAGQLDVVQQKLDAIIGGDFPSALQKKARDLRQALQASEHIQN